MIAPLVGVVLPIIHKTDRVTYKLKLNHGDLKATQGDTGHAEIDMITKVYAHILDEDRKINAQKFESAFYANPDLRNVKPPRTGTASGTNLRPGSIGRTASKISGACKYPRSIAYRSKGRVKSQISKKAIFLSKRSILVRFQLARNSL